MIKYFSVENFYSIDSKQEIDFCLGIKKESKFEANPVIGILGANASGKTNVLRALSFMVWFFKDSFLRIPPDMLIPFEQFGNNKNKSTIFKLEITNTDKAFYIELHLNHEEVIIENIHYKLKKKYSNKILAYERIKTKVDFNKKIKKINYNDLRKNSSIISLFNKYETQNIAKEIYEIEFLSNVIFSGYNPNLLLLDQNTLKKIDSDSVFKKWLFDHLDIADIGITDIKINIIENNIIPDFKHNIKNEIIYLKHIHESSGTIKFITLCYRVYNALNQGSVLIIDEIELQLHNNLLAFFVDLFKNPNTNKNGAQLIFTSHNTSILQDLELGQVFFTEKNDSGQTDLYSAFDFKGMKGYDLEKIYRIGRLGAIPRGI